MTPDMVGSASNHRDARRKMRRRLEARGFPPDEIDRIVAERRDEQDARRRAAHPKPRRTIPDIAPPEERLAACGPPPTVEQRGLVIERDGRWCRYCGNPVSQGARLLKERLTIDHVTPISRGGSNWANNRVVACDPCNTKKKNRTPDEWGHPLLPPRGHLAVEASTDAP